MTALEMKCIRAMEFTSAGSSAHPDRKACPPENREAMPQEIGNHAKLLRSSSDADLLALLRDGKKDALGILYDRYSRLVYGLALRILANPQEAEDLTHEIFLTLWHRNTYDPARGSADTFLSVLTRSRAMDKLRSRSLLVRVLQRWGQAIAIDPPPPTPLENSLLEQRSQQVREALCHLSEQQQRVLEMAYFQNLSQSEISKQLDIPLGTIKSWCRQGLIKLRRDLQDLDE